MRPPQWLVLWTLLLTLLLAAPGEAQVESWMPMLRPDPFYEFVYLPCITVIMRTAELLQGIAGSYRGELSNCRSFVDCGGLCLVFGDVTCEVKIH